MEVIGLCRVVMGNREMGHGMCWAMIGFPQGCGCEKRNNIGMALNIA